MEEVKDLKKAAAALKGLNMQPRYPELFHGRMWITREELKALYPESSGTGEPLSEIVEVIF